MKQAASDRDQMSINKHQHQPDGQLWWEVAKGEELQVKLVLMKKI